VCIFSNWRNRDATPRSPSCLKSAWAFVWRSRTQRPASGANACPRAILHAPGSEAVLIPGEVARESGMMSPANPI